jgi:hypothetical protein
MTALRLALLFATSAFVAASATETLSVKVFRNDITTIILVPSLVCEKIGLLVPG